MIDWLKSLFPPAPSFNLPEWLEWHESGFEGHSDEVDE